ncbi:FAD-dependent pyridine nucleotide reductase signature [Acididesulfobacillus acetoxydans]|uniref:Coenzyme A disulfide reductase n=1 Tax=Acididesulfobacillus acetoxydans TaxID=1561005 RepID=A0A8S0W420_9FIRM|nr:FAD-dependent oxidoreductase [Acididesulfobacillus acetoxydans]CAA7602178.1 FAD-dependent pyridine nucleotide reductase signature [Acididesulfobacillus acetoxydans]CEJ08734.1 Coenzyme A disulfide reductase [Acididesulfobacillus acetoxydans]
MRVVIIGGVATGPKVAARLRRLRQDAEIVIIEQGNLISYGGCGLPLYLGNMVPEMDDLMRTSTGVLRDREYFLKYKGIEVVTATRAERIERDKKRVTLRSLTTGETWSLDYDYLVLATGARPLQPPLPGVGLEGVFPLHHPDDAAAIRQLIRQKQVKNITIIGAGLIGLEVADALSHARVNVTVCESEGQVLPKLLDSDMAPLVAREMEKRHIGLRLGSLVTELEDDGKGRVCGVRSREERWAADLVIVSVGVRPNVHLAEEAGLSLGVAGAIRVDEHLQTDDPYIYAAGDCAEQKHRLTGQPVFIPLASTAAKQGRVIADRLAGLDSSFAGVEGTSVMQAFDLNVGRTGLTEEEAVKAGYDCVALVASGYDSTHYYALHAGIVLKLVAERTSGKLLGAQVCGLGDGIKRLDVLATALSFGATVRDLADLDLGYAPPFATAVDAVIQASYALENKRNGKVHSISARALRELIQAGTGPHVLDVREQDEVDADPLRVPNVIHMPLSRLRETYRDLPVSPGLVTFCGLGIRAYEAACFLQSKVKGDISFMEGGMAVWQAFT